MVVLVGGCSRYCRDQVKAMGDPALPMALLHRGVGLTALLRCGSGEGHLGKLAPYLDGL